MNSFPNFQIFKFKGIRQIILSNFLFPSFLRICYTLDFTHCVPSKIHLKVKTFFYSTCCNVQMQFIRSCQWLYGYLVLLIFVCIAIVCYDIYTYTYHKMLMLINNYSHLHFFLPFLICCLFAKLFLLVFVYPALLYMHFVKILIKLELGSFYSESCAFCIFFDSPIAYK